MFKKYSFTAKPKKKPGGVRKKAGWCYHFSCLFTQCENLIESS